MKSLSVTFKWKLRNWSGLKILNSTFIILYKVLLTLNWDCKFHSGVWLFNRNYLGVHSCIKLTFTIFVSLLIYHPSLMTTMHDWVWLGHFTICMIHKALLIFYKIVLNWRTTNVKLVCMHNLLPRSPSSLLTCIQFRYLSSLHLTYRRRADIKLCDADLVFTATQWGRLQACEEHPSRTDPCIQPWGIDKRHHEDRARPFLQTSASVAYLASP